MTDFIKGERIYTPAALAGDSDSITSYVKRGIVIKCCKMGVLVETRGKKGGTLEEMWDITTIYKTRKSCEDFINGVTPPTQEY